MVIYEFVIILFVLIGIIYVRVEFECKVMLYEIRFKSLNKNTEYKDSFC